EIHIGTPIANTEIYILDSSLQPVPIGVAGELLISGDGLARGYLKGPDITAERFIPHPFRHGAKLYRTGDLAKYRSDGSVVWLGRTDFQVKLRGHRVELGEIEAAFGEMHGIVQTFVVCWDDQIVAYYATESRKPLTASACREFLRDRLPEYMLPSSYVHLETIPLTANGKVDRKALPKPGAKARPSSRLIARTETEQKLLTMWEEVLKRNPIGVDDTS